MLNRIRTAASACVAAALLAGTVTAQDSARRSTELRPRAEGSKVEVHKISTVMKSKVLIQEDAARGQVVDFVLSDGGCINYVVASYEDEFYAIPYSAITLRDRAVFVDISPAQFKKIEFFAENDWPDFSSRTFERTVVDVFGVDQIRNDGSRTTLKPDLDAQDRREDRRDDRRDRREDLRDDRRDDRQDRRSRDDAGTAGERGADNTRDRLQDRKDEPRSKSATDSSKSEPKSDLGGLNPKQDREKADQPKKDQPKSELPKAEKPREDNKPIAPAPKPKSN